MDSNLEKLVSVAKSLKTLRGLGVPDHALSGVERWMSFQFAEYEPPKPADVLAAEERPRKYDAKI